MADDEKAVAEAAAPEEQPAAEGADAAQNDDAGEDGAPAEKKSSVISDDPEIRAQQDKAALKIQSVYRGSAVRKEVQGKKEALKERQAAEAAAAAAAAAAPADEPEEAAAAEGDGKAEEEAAAPAEPVDDTPANRTIEKTLALIKPDAVAKGVSVAIKQRIADAGFTIVQEKLVRFHPLSVRGFYAEHEDKPFFPKLAKFMTSGPARALVLARADAVNAWRELMGPTDSDVARDQAPDSLRALFGTDKTRNATHGSDSRESAAREIAFLFPQQLPQPDLADPREYIEHAVSPTLTEGLAALCKHKPENPALWLANWLLQHNPNKPQVQMPKSVPQNA